MYLLDVEGTVAPLSLTSEVLFPYARAHFESFLNKNFERPKRYASDLGAAGRGEPRGDRSSTCRGLSSELPARRGWKHLQFRDGTAFAYMLWLMDRDRKSTALKSSAGQDLEGRIRERGAEGHAVRRCAGGVPRWSGRGAAWPSIHRARWRRRSCSSATRIYGDLTPLISGYFDTRTGPKLAERRAMRRLRARCGIEPGNVLFFSDVGEGTGCGARCRMPDATGDAAREMHRLTHRHGHAMIRSFERGGGR